MQKIKFIAIVCLSLLSFVTLAQIPEGAKKIFNGKDLKGWHLSRTTHQGTTPYFRVENGEIVNSPRPYGQGGLLLTDKKYKNFDFYVEVKIDSFTNGGIFIRSTESGMAYQIEFAENSGATADLIGERMQVSLPAKALDKAKVWKPEDWNSFRIRMVGDIPHITLWVNGVQMWDVTQPKNDFVLEATEGFIALQSHWTALYSSTIGGNSGIANWAPGKTQKYRNIWIKELPDDLKE